MKPEVNDLPLVVRKGLEDVDDLTQPLPPIVLLVEIACDRHLRVLERCAPGRRPARVECEVPAHGEQPRRDVAADPLRVLTAETEERLLHHIACRVQVAEKPRRVAEQGLLVQRQGIDDPIGFRRPNHVLPDGITELRQVY